MQKMPDTFVDEVVINLQLN